MNLPTSKYTGAPLGWVRLAEASFIINAIEMLGTSFLLLAFAATGLAQVPEGYRKVYITSKVNAKFVVVPKAPTSGSTLIV